MSLKPEDVVKVLLLIGEMAQGIASVANALNSGMTKEGLEIFIDEHDKVQKELRQAIMDEINEED